MPKNLRYKIGLLMDDLEILSKPDAIKKIERFVKDELNFMESEYEFGVSDLVQMRSSAIQRFSDLESERIQIGRYGGGSSSEKRTLAYLEAAIGLLRSKELISFRVKFKNK